MSAYKSQIERRESYKEVFSTEEGKRVLADLASLFGCGNVQYNGEPNDLIYREGQRSVALHIIHAVNYKPQDPQFEDIQSTYDVLDILHEEMRNDS